MHFVLLSTNFLESVIDSKIEYFAVCQYMYSYWTDQASMTAV